MNSRQTIDSGHAAPVTDLSTDALGKRLASGSEDGSIRIWETRENGQLNLICSLQAHQDGVVQTAWAPPRFQGNGFVSIGCDQQLHLWRDSSGTKQWTCVFSKNLPSQPQSISWCPGEFGQIFACGCSDGNAYVFWGHDEQWDITPIDAHPSVGCTGVSWAPFLWPGSLCTLPLSQQHQNQAQGSGTPVPRLVTCGNERPIRLWRYAQQDKHWIKEQELNDGLGSCWNDIQWAPNIGLPFTTIAAGSDDGFVNVWTQDGFEGKWKALALPQLDEAVVRLSWSTIGTFLLVSCASGTATMWKEAPSGEWQQLSTVSSPARGTK
jgi:protein transport protein SEC13